MSISNKEEHLKLQDRNMEVISKISMRKAVKLMGSKAETDELVSQSIWDPDSMGGKQAV